MSFRPLIGVTATRRRGRAMWWCNHLALARAGAAALRITPDRAYPIERLHGIVVGGGDDIDAALYGGRLNPRIRLSPARDALELRILDWAARLGIPVLGICRGAQMINVHRGGSLHADIDDAFHRAPKLRTVLPKKLVRLDKGSQVARILGRTTCRVNALHHQSIDRPGDGVRRVGRDEFGIVQAIEVPSCPFMIGVQWHPEFLVLDPAQQNLFRALAAAARAKAEHPEQSAGCPIEAQHRI
jgi:putative glutamine amidotransferase